MTPEWQDGDIETLASFEFPEDRLGWVQAPDLEGAIAADADAVIQRDLVGDGIPSGILQGNDASFIITTGDRIGPVGFFIQHHPVG